MRRISLFTRLILGVLLPALASGGCRGPAGAAPTPPPAATSTGAPTLPPLPPTTTGAQAAAPTPTVVYPAVPYDRISLERILAYLDGLTSIQPYSGWRNTASSGEAEALDYVAGLLDGFSNLQQSGLELERQRYKVFAGVELWETGLRLTVQGREIEVPADGLRGSRYIPQLALSLDSDGKANDSQRDPRTAEAPLLPVQDAETLLRLTTKDVDNRILFLDYALVDTVVNGNYRTNGEKLMQLINGGLEGLVLVTRYSNRDGESRGTFVGDGGVFQFLDHMARVPILYARLEDLAPAGITSWEDLAQVQAAHLTWDADVFIPGESGNLVARIPGVDGSRAVILTAHVDSPNGPGAFDDAGGSAILLEIARIIDVTGVRPAVDLYLVWLGGHELGTYGSAHFAATHQELLDRTAAMMGIDGVGYAFDGRAYAVGAGYTPNPQAGGESAPWPDFLAQAVQPHGVSLHRQPQTGLIADNSNFDAFDVPNINLEYIDYEQYQARGGPWLHYASHWHDPYETVELARAAGDTFMQMAKTALAAALETGRTPMELRLTPSPDRRALFVGSHTEPDTVAPALLRELGMALAWEGFDVDYLPYRQPLAASDLEDAGLVLLLPTLDYPGPSSEAWSAAELALLTEYVKGGGFLVATNSAANLASARQLDDANEDATDLNPLLEPMGIRFLHGSRGGGVVRITADHPLTREAKYLTSAFDGLQAPLIQTGGVVFAAGAIGLLDYGSQGGQVLVIADIGLLMNNADGAKNLNFVQNIAAYAGAR